MGGIDWVIMVEPPKWDSCHYKKKRFRALSLPSEDIARK